MTAMVTDARVLSTFAHLRGDGTKQRWKVTAHYTVEVSDGVEISCVRLRSPYNGSSRYLSLQRYRELYVEES